MARRTLNRKALREQSEAAERLKEEEEKDESEEDEEDDDEEEEDGAEDEASGDDAEADDDGDDDDDDDDAPKKKKKKKVVKKKPVAKAKKAPAKRTRTPKVVRMKVVWAVYSNSHSIVEEFPYPKKAEAEAYLAKITNDKKSGGPFFLQPLKKPFDKD